MGDEEVRQAKQDKVSKDKPEKKSGLARAPIKKEKSRGMKERLQEAVASVKGDDKKEKQEKPLLEREYIVPLRKGWLKVPEYKRANKAVKTLKEFIAQHMKIYDRDLRKVKVDVLVNNEIRFRGMKKPLNKIKVKAIKYNDRVEVKLVDIPKHIEFELARKAKKEVEKLKKQAEKPVVKPEVKKEETEEESKDKKEKEAASKEATQAMEKQAAKTAKHTAVKKAPVVQRKALQK